MANNHISDELLAAFMEGNVNEQELAQVLRAARTDAELQEVLNIALEVNDESHPMLQMAAEGRRNLCDVQCETFILNEMGDETTVDELFEIAKDKHWLRRTGTPLYCIGNILEYKGLEVKRMYDATLDDIKTLLNEGWGVIVAVDSDKLYPERIDEEDETNHAVVVTGIDADSDQISIYDPSNTTKVDIKQPLFMSAWNESHNYLVSACNKKKTSKVIDS
ncbi:MAG: C39 family peptidase [Bacteroidaceae bacterium]|nr:C39 family peptidase [Bacteroidaceae bacterium]